MEKLVHCRSVRPNAKMNLFCFPWLGGGSLFHAKWSEIFPESIEVNSIRLPGRENRFRDTLYTDLEVLKDDVCRILLPKLKEKPFIFFGHSLGALLAYAVASHLKQHYDIEPQHLIVSGTSCPQSPKRKDGSVKWGHLTEDEFIERLTNLGGTPPALLANRGMMRLTMKTFKADSNLLDDYETHVPLEAVLTCPVSMFNGDQDREHDSEGWGDLSTGDFSYQKLPGHHFYLQQDVNARKISAHIVQMAGL